MESDSKKQKRARRTFTDEIRGELQVELAALVDLKQAGGAAPRPSGLMPR